jgi:heme/copper-type cytochrome/quinol oxidase subunit 1
MSTWGAVIQAIAGFIGLYNIWYSRRNGEVSGDDPWARLARVPIPSPPPEYNFETVPTVTSRYPLWDIKSPELTSACRTRVTATSGTTECRRQACGAFHDHMSAGTPEGGVNPHARQA